MTRRAARLTPQTLLTSLAGGSIGFALTGHASIWVGVLGASFIAFKMAVTWFSAPTEAQVAARDREWLADINRDYAKLRTVEDRLDELERLKRRDMVTPEEYAAKRQEILKDL